MISPWQLFEKNLLVENMLNVRVCLMWGKKKKPNPILLSEDFSFYIYMCVCIYVYMRPLIIFIIFIGLFPVKDFSSSFSFPLYLPHIKVIPSKNYTVCSPAVLPSVRFFSSFFFTGSFLSNDSLVSIREKTVCP